MKQTSLLGIPVSVISRMKLLDEITDAINYRRHLSIVAINARKIVRAVREPEMKKLIMEFDVFLADGLSIVKALKMDIERITGIDLMEDICRYSEKTGASIFFYGASENSNREAVRKLKQKYPAMKVAGSCNGYDDSHVADQIRRSGADIVFVAKGTPLQERWIIKHGRETGASILMGVGGSFDVFSGQVKRAPKFIQNMGMEWLYRMICDPRRFKQIPELIEFWRMVKKEKKQEFRMINGGGICKAKK